MIKTDRRTDKSRIALLVKIPHHARTQLVEFEGDEYNSAVANSVEDAKKLIEAGFEYVCNYENVMIFRKRK